LFNFNILSGSFSNPHQFPLAGARVWVAAGAELELTLVVVLDLHVAHARGETMAGATLHLAGDPELNPRRWLARQRVQQRASTGGTERAVIIVDQAIRDSGDDEAVDHLAREGSPGAGCHETTDPGRHNPDLT
jgi:hypothetical protein